jgi:hypothetical protein
MPISKDLKDKAQKTRQDGVFTLKLDEGVSLAMLVSFAKDMFPGVSTRHRRLVPADDGELVVSVRGDGGIQSKLGFRSAWRIWPGLARCGSIWLRWSGNRRDRTESVPNGLA